MKWSRFSSVEAWKALAFETACRVAARGESIVHNPTWPLSRPELENTHIFWPSQYEWEPSRKWVEPLLHGFGRYVTVERADIPQPYEGIVLIQVRIGERRHDVAIDYSDLADVNQSCAQRCGLYFKMQFARGGYSPDQIIPGGFVPNSEDIYNYLPNIRATAHQKSYSTDVYGRFGLEFGGEIRRKAYALLAEQNHFRWEGSLSTKRYSLGLREIARSKVCIDLPGKGDFCFRLVDYMAVGACIVALRHRVTLHVPLIDGEHIAYVKDDLSDLIDVCRFYVQNDDARETLRQNSRAFFDKYLHRNQLAAYYLRCCLDRLG